MEATNAPYDIVKGLHFGKAILNTEYEIPDGRLRIRAGQSILTEVPLHHNKPDVMVQILTRDPQTLLFEVSVPHLQNYRTQEGIKRVKYTKNSMVDINHRNYKTISRDTNLADQLAHLHRCKVKLGLLIIGCYGEVLNTEEHRKFQGLMQTLGVPNYKTQRLLNNATYSVFTQTTQILMKHLRE